VEDCGLEGSGSLKIPTAPLGTIALNPGASSFPVACCRELHYLHTPEFDDYTDLCLNKRTLDKAKPFVRRGRKAADLEPEMAELPKEGPLACPAFFY